MSEFDSEDDGTSLEAPASAPLENTPSPASKKLAYSGSNISRKTIGILSVAALLLLSGGGYALVHKPAKKEVAKPTLVTINTQSLDNGTLNKLTTKAAGDAPVKQQLVISPDTVFKNTVHIFDTTALDKDLNIGGNLNVKSATTLQGPTVINSNLAVRGSLSVSGVFTAPNLNVGTLTTSAVNATGNLNFGGHLVPSGAVPTAKPSVAIGGGTVTVSGNDSAGTITITTGNGSLTAGEMAIISFHTAFSTTPKVQLTPITDTAAELNYYATRSTTFFTIDTTTVPSATKNYVFDYLITQ